MLNRGTMKISKLFRLSLFQSVLLAMLVVAVIPLSLIWYTDYRSTTEQISKSIEEKLAESSQYLITQMDDWIDMHVRALNQNATLGEMISMDASKQNPILRSISNQYSSSYLVFTILPNGDNIGRSDGKKSISYADRQYFQQVLAGQAIGKELVVSKTTGKPALILAVPIRRTTDTGEKELVGVLAMGMSIARMSERIADFNLGTGGHAFLLEESGKVVAHRKQEYANVLTDFSQHVAFTQRSTDKTKQLFYEEQGKKVIAYATPSKHGWILVAQQSVEDAYAALHLSNRRALILLGITLVVVTIAAYFFAQSLVRPIEKLTLMADEMSRGKTYPVIEEAERTDEIGALAAAISRLGTSVRVAMHRMSARR